MPKLDDVSWHAGGDGFPPGLPEENGATHIGFFATWLIRNGHWIDFLGTNGMSAVEAVRTGQMSARTFVIQECDGKLLTEMMSAEIAPFAEAYYNKRYLPDYHKALGGGHSSDYLIADTETNYTTMAAVIDQRYSAWRKGPSRPWWKFW